MNYYYIPEEPYPEFPDYGREFTEPTTIVLPFHINSEFKDIPVEPRACAHCHCSTFNLGVGSFYTCLRCTNCKREWCEHSG